MIPAEKKKVGSPFSKADRELLLQQRKLEMHKHAISAGTIARIVDLLRHCVSLGAVIGTIYFLINGLQAYLGKDVSSVVELVESLNLGNIILMVWAVSATGVTLSYKRRTTALIKQISTLRRLVEKNDANNESSGLTDSGETPMDEDDDFDNF